MCVFIYSEYVAKSEEYMRLGTHIFREQMILIIIIL